MKVNFPIISQHATWIGVNPVQGCPKRCKYCFLQSQNKTGIKPEILMGEEETIIELLNSPHYTEESILSFFTNTDAFATKDNMNFLENILLECDKHNIYNVKTFITKCSIPDKFIDLFEKLIKKGHKIIVYLSYSGLDNTIERGISHEKIRENFIRLSDRNIPIIHYWRPFVPQNSQKHKLEEVFNFVSKYSTASVIAGLKIEEMYYDNLDFWPELTNNNRKKILMAEGIWPKGVIEFFEELKANNNQYPFFQSNSCALAHALKKPDSNAFNNTKICNFNNCPLEQRELCNSFYKNISFSEKEFIKTMNLLGYDTDKINYKLTDANEIHIFGITMSVADQSFITQKFHKRVLVNKLATDIYWNTSVNGSEPLEI
ncbi:radical SAM protein [Solibacillus sp. NPDC093137]|uniref:radical SAM protein n=1 Tax=Solibacillus sp. NPDC093137 TaxID=3390678 RepID=UPI003CFDF7BF